MPLMFSNGMIKFQLTRLMRGVTQFRSVFIYDSSFQLTRLMRGVTLESYDEPVSRKFQLTRLMRGVTPQYRRYYQVKNISTHTPHARRDPLFLILAMP